MQGGVVSMRMEDALARPKLAKASNHPFCTKPQVAPDSNFLQPQRHDAADQTLFVNANKPQCPSATWHAAQRGDELSFCLKRYPRTASLRAQGRAVDAIPSEITMMLSTGKPSKSRGSARKRGSECLHCQFTALGHILRAYFWEVN